MSRIVAAAIRLPNGIILTMPPPARHHDIVQNGNCGETRHTQGFLTSNGQFVTRTQAANIAVEAGQVHWDCIHSTGQLFSEDLW